FFQIKSQNQVQGKWTITKLTKREKGAKGVKQSILGKLYSNFLRVGDLVKGLHFISNVSYDFKLQSGESSESLQVIECTKLSTEQLKIVCNRLEEEFKQSCSLPTKPSLQFQVTPLGVLGHETYAKGKLAEYFEEIAPGKKHPVASAYRVVLEEVRRKTNYE